jgi:hypothetical protein
VEVREEEGEGLGSRQHVVAVREEEGDKGRAAIGTSWR